MSVIWKGQSSLIRQWSGADLTLADRVMASGVYRGPLALCVASTLRRGTYGTGDRLGWVVTRSTVNAERKGIGLLTIAWEVGGPWASPAFLPLPDYRCEVVELYPKVERNKHMYGLSYPRVNGDRISTMTIALCYQAVHGVPPKDIQARTAIQNMDTRTSAPPAGSSWDDQAAWGAVLLDWLDHGHETYYQAGLKYSYVWHPFTWPALSMGGVIEPFPNGGPMMGDAAYSWLRLADAPEPNGVNGSCHKVTSTWLGGPNGHWDPVLYV